MTSYFSPLLKKKKYGTQKAYEFSATNFFLCIFTLIFSFSLFCILISAVDT